MPLPPRRARAQALARTYGGDRDPWERVEEYQRVLEYRGEHPDKGSSAVASALELPRGRIRPWFDGAKPDPVRGIDAAEERSWLDVDPGDPVFDGLTVLHAWIFAGGSIQRDTYVPAFAVGEADPAHLCRAALEAVGLDVTEAHVESSSRATEFRPSDAASPFGRFLVGALEAPAGEKAADADITIPEWVTDMPEPARLLWARTYVTLRGTPFPEVHGYTLQIKEKRPQTYLRSLKTVFDSVVDDPATVAVGKHVIRLKPAAVDRLDRTPSLSDGV